MAGNYPDAPSWRMAIDRDGSIGFAIPISGTVFQFDSNDMQVINNESVDYVDVRALCGSLIPYYIGVVFPEKRDIDAYFIEESTSSNTNTYSVQVSANTTNGLDGTWTSFGPEVIYDNVYSVQPEYRSPLSGTALAVRGIRMAWISNNGITYRLHAFHLYGEVAPGENPNRLVLWHPTLDQRVGPAYFDWGDTPRSSSADKTFRVKNMSSTLSANSVRVALETLTDGVPSVPAQHALSTDATSFTAQVNVGVIAPGLISDVLTLRRNTPANAQLGLYALRVFAEANTWS